MLDYTKVVFVSKSDTGRGPLAAEMMKKKLDIINDDIISRGLVVLFPEPVNPKFVAIAASKGIDLANRSSVVLSEDDFGPRVLVLTMDEKYKEAIYEEFTNAVNVYTLKEFVGDDGDVVNPHGGELSDYGNTYESLDELIDQVIDKLQEPSEE